MNHQIFFRDFTLNACKHFVVFYLPETIAGNNNWIYKKRIQHEDKKDAAVGGTTIQSPKHQMKITHIAFSIICYHLTKHNVMSK